MKKKEITYETLKTKREFLSCPGDTILETLGELDITQSEFAAMMGMSFPESHALISGETRIKKDLAEKLESVLKIPVQFWINREKLYRRKLAWIEREEIKLKFKIDV